MQYLLGAYLMNVIAPPSVPDFRWSHLFGNNPECLDAKLVSTGLIGNLATLSTATLLLTDLSIVSE